MPQATGSTSPFQVDTQDDKEDKDLPTICQPQTRSFRIFFSAATHALSDFVNENLITIRYAALSSVLLLGAYSISQTPLFFRYRTVKEIPNSLYQRRRVLTGRAFQVAPLPDAAAKKQTFTAPIILYVRHLSPMGRLLSKNLFEWGLQYSPTTAALGRVDSRDLIRIQLFGVCQESVAPPLLLLDQLVLDRTLVRCQLVASTSDDTEPMAAIARIYYRERTPSWWAVDLGSHLVENGLARVQADVVLGRNGSNRLEDKQRDIQYLESLSKLQYEAISNRRGMWSIPMVRASARDLVEHAKLETSARWYQKIWRRLRGKEI